MRSRYKIPARQIPCELFKMKIPIRHFTSTFVPRIARPPLIYVVDDMPCLTQLYSIILERTGYVVRTFNNRPTALEALKANCEKPDLLITDYVNPSMPVDRFMLECNAIRPEVRILMVTGLDQSATQLSPVKPDRFLRKPFTPDELRQEVEATLASD